ncbi:MAG: DUF1893 domain-containing protein [Ruminococcus sp.]|nr:DUF1893 domain-containing protein [Ruminococcus sp.]
MTDIDIAKANLEGHSICLCKDGDFFTDDGRGISPMIRFIGENRDLNGYSAADIIVGKAAAMLFVRAGIVSVHGRTMSVSAREFLERHGIACTFETLTERIINRQGTDVCPMEKTVVEIEDVEDGYRALKTRLEEMKNNK